MQITQLNIRGATEYEKKNYMLSNTTIGDILSTQGCTEFVSENGKEITLKN